MNDYLVTYDGGQDVWADDLSFMQNSLKSMIDTAVRTYGDNCILWGCLDSGKANVVEGGVVISGKLYQVPALGAIGSNKLCFREVLSDERTFENQQVHKVKKQYEAYLSTDTSGTVAWCDLKTMNNSTKVEYKKDAYIELTEEAKRIGWVSPEVWYVNVPGGKMVFCVLGYNNTDSQDYADIGYFRGISFPNTVYVSAQIQNNTIERLPALVTIYGDNCNEGLKRKIEIRVPVVGNNNEGEADFWSVDPPRAIKGKFLIQFNFFLADEVVTYNYSDFNFNP